MRFIERLTITGKGSDISKSLGDPIRFEYNKKYEVCLLSLNMYNDIPNVTNKNNKFKFTNNINDPEINWKTIELPLGAYQFEDINNKIIEEMCKNDDYDKEKNEFYINILPNIPEQKSIINITNENYGILFDDSNSIASILGFNSNDSKILRKGSHKSENTINITPTNIVLVNVNFAYGGYNNESKSSAIFAFDPNIVNPGWKIMITPKHFEYYLIRSSAIVDNRIQLTDEDSNLLDIKNTEVTIRLEIREII